MFRFLRRIRRDTRGVSALEFALLLPVLVVLAVGTIEFGRLILLTQKLQNGTFILADLAARDRTLSEEQLQNIFLALATLIEPFEFANSGTAIVSSVVSPASGPALIAWQRQGAGALTAQSAVGAAGAVADLPDTLVLAPNETLIVSEIVYSYTPIFGMLASDQTLRRTAYFKPRLGTLETLLP